MSDRQAAYEERSFERMERDRPKPPMELRELLDLAKRAAEDPGLLVEWSLASTPQAVLDAVAADKWDRDHPYYSCIGTTEVLEYEHCAVVTEDCEDPPGYMMGGGVARSTEEPTCNPLDDCCTHCGNVMCTACRAEDTEDGYPQCKYCAEEE